MPSSNSPHAPAATTSTPTSVRSKTCRVRSTRISPRAPTSSIPAVSMNSTGPIGSSSIGFSTGSVVVPATSETIDTSCRVRAFSSDDLPTLRRPNRPMCRRNPLGVESHGGSCVSEGCEEPGMLVEPRRVTRSGGPVRRTAPRQQALLDHQLANALAGRPGQLSASRLAFS